MGDKKSTKLLMFVPRGCAFPCAVLLFLAMIYEMCTGNISISNGLGVMAFCVVAAIVSLGAPRWYTYFPKPHLSMPRGCAIIGVCMAFFVGVVFLFGLHKGNEDLTGGGVMYIIIGLVGLYGLFGSKGFPANNIDDKSRVSLGVCAGAMRHGRSRRHGVLRHRSDWIEEMTPLAGAPKGRLKGKALALALLKAWLQALHDCEDAKGPPIVEYTAPSLYARDDSNTGNQIAENWFFFGNVL